ncbi:MULTISPECIES: c-type cytochrome [unclassified Caballeronia]|uniref:c-type cytochrome n=1 Tax=unclassified Caballeronia TaxID=2646786 RepID=UPI00285A2EC4|nr:MULTISPECIES: c-type cytochrome [unclassified Caballeronia]MDR5814860.1 c-type cytochrome [Caballeronia sp. LZ033]MDR5821341.1 c-type cytochrome [Caballeronia sp. LZ043]MDR5879518.1 c-type cytochrome [Caballeronia sp. LZ032]
MSEAPHGAPIKTPGQLIVAIIAGFGIPVAIIILLAVYVNNSTRTGAGTDIEASVKERIAPAAQVDVRDANAPRVYKTGEEVFKAVCSACHAAGTAGAPKFGDAGAWAPRISEGYDTLLHNALNGKGAMPARGGTNPDDYSDFEIARAVVYMANNGGAKFAEPAQPAPGAAASAAGAASAPAAASSNDNAQAAAAVAALASVPQAAPAPAAGAQSADAAQAGKALYEQVCQACHAAGVLGAPKFGDKAAWAPRLKEPMDTVYNYALHGKGAMPPKGGSNAPDADVKAAVDYMVNASK